MSLFLRSSASASSSLALLSSSLRTPMASTTRRLCHIGSGGGGGSVIGRTRSTLTTTATTVRTSSLLSAGVAADDDGTGAHRQESFIQKRRYISPSILTRKIHLCNNDSNHYNNNLQRRNFHATPQREIVPLIGAAAVLVLGRYSYKALKRMDEEWEEYQWELQRYEKQLHQTQQTKLTQKALSIDLGSMYTKLATSHPKLEVVVSREGDRSFFSGVAYDPREVENDNAVPLARGTRALEKFFYKPLAAADATSEDDYEKQSVKLPWLIMTTQLEGKSSSDVEKEATSVVSHSLSPALGEAFERLNYKSNTNSSSSSDAEEKENEEENDDTPRKIIAIPMAHEPLHVLPAIISVVLQADVDPPTLLPEPVAAIWGAQHKGLLPLDDTMESHTTTLVIDVGALTTQFSMIRKDIILHAVAFPFGGETFVRLAVDLLVKEAAASHSQTSLKDARSLSAIQSNARSAVIELTKNTRVNVHVPYLFPDPKNHHLDTELSRPVLEQSVSAYIREHLNGKLAEQQEPILSPHMPAPTDLTMLFTSVITQILENSQQTPNDIHHVLLLGGGSKPPMVPQAVRNALFGLFGAERKLVVPEPSLATELVVLGAATMLPSYDYSIEHGLQRREGV